jgi:hypothetical protein
MLFLGYGCMAVSQSNSITAVARKVCLLLNLPASE